MTIQTTIDSSQHSDEQSASVTYNEKDWIVVGKVLKAVGLKGKVKVQVLSDNPKRFRVGESLFLQKKTELTPLKIKFSKDTFDLSKIEVLFEDHTTREQATLLANSFLVIPKNERMPLKDNENFYPDELSGMQIYSEKGELIGKVISLESEVPSPYLVTEITNYGEILIPFRKIFIDSINRKNKLIKLAQPISVHIPGNQS